jgi:hypothetical protein
MNKLKQKQKMSEHITPPPFEQSGMIPPVNQPESFSLPNSEVFSPRMEQVFTPVANPDNGNEDIASEDEYDFLFDTDENSFETSQLEYAKKQEFRRASNEGRARTTEDSLAYSKQVLERFDTEPQLDFKIKEIIHKYAESDKLASEKTMQAIRSNKYLRMELGAYFISKLDNMRESLPPRVARNEQKKPGMPGYEGIPNLRSREYASLLAFAQLDGTFDPEKSASEHPTYNETTGQIETGQHRAASEMLLFW